jgi:membrane protein
MSLGFGFYVSNFSAYNATYGTLGGVVVTLVWFYLSSFVVLLGAEVNAVLTREAAPEELQRPARGDTPASETPPTYQQQPR